MTVTIDPHRYHAVIFDLDGVVTDTASVHAAAWQRLFDEYLARREPHAGEDHSPFTDADYRRYVDGRPRYDGVAGFLGSRGISLPRGHPSDSEDGETVCGLGNRKNRYFRERLDSGGVTVFESTVALVSRLQDAGLGTAVFSASRNCQPVLEAAGLGDLFPVRVDGVVAERLGLPGKPDPAVLLEAVRRLGGDPARSVVVEDAEAGVEAGRRGGFGLVIGVDRSGHAEQLRGHGAEVVVGDVSDVEVRPAGRPMSTVPDALASWDELAGRLRRRRPAVFLDFDGTLSDIVPDPDAAVLVDGARSVLERTARRCPVAIISGRDLRDVRSRVGLDELWYAGSHGFELAGPGGQHHELEAARGAQAALDDAEATVGDRLVGVPGVLVDRKRFTLAVHYRNVDEALADRVVDAVREIADRDDRLRVTGGRKVIELLPNVDWDKGRALQWLLDRVVEAKEALPVYAGDDLTDEDALRVVATEGIGIVVRHQDTGDRPSAAQVAVDSPAQLCVLLNRLADACADAPDGPP
jgi:alpha,alpha-trehalase